MADFESAVSRTIKNEGGDKFTETPGDKGGATKYGISLTFLVGVYKKDFKKYSRYYPDSLFKENPTKETVKNLTIEQAKSLYKIYFWIENRYGEIKNQAIADKVFDMAVLMGAPMANKILQKTISENHLICDGIIGNESLRWINDNFDPEDYFMWINNYIKHFISICNKDRSQDRFLLGWLNRVMS